MLYNFDEWFSNQKKKIENLENEKNKQVILEFLNKLFAEGLSKPRVLKYGYHLMVMSRSIDFDAAAQEDITQFLSDLEQSSYSELTKCDYRIVLRRFFSYLGKEHLIRDVKTTLKRNKKKLPEILTESEIEKMIKAAKHPRNKAIIGVLYECGLRVGELASLRIRDVEFDKDGAVIKVRGKTGERRVRLVMFSSSIAKWIEMHPYSDDENAPLWISLSNSSRSIQYRAIDKCIKIAARKAGIKKKVTTHVFRHSRATHLANYLTEAQMNIYFGWIQGSDMPATYVHLSGRDVDDRILEIHGLKSKKRDKENEMKPKQCPRCQYINSPFSRYCGRCGTVLNEEERIKLEIQSRQVSKKFPVLSIGDTELLEEMRKFRDMLELFEKDPELYKRMRAMVEKHKS